LTGLLGGLILHVLRDVLVQVTSDRDAAVTETVRHDLERHALLEQQRRRRVPTSPRPRRA
jgi:hypothetical protein